MIPSKPKMTYRLVREADVQIKMEPTDFGFVWHNHCRKTKIIRPNAGG